MAENQVPAAPRLCGRTGAPGHGFHAKAPSRRGQTRGCGAHEIALRLCPSGASGQTPCGTMGSRRIHGFLVSSSFGAPAAPEPVGRLGFCWDLGFGRCLPAVVGDEGGGFPRANPAAPSRPHGAARRNHVIATGVSATSAPNVPRLFKPGTRFHRCCGPRKFPPHASPKKFLTHSRVRLRISSSIQAGPNKPGRRPPGTPIPNFIGKHTFRRQRLC
jgi:hypothetical protein